MNCPHCDRKLIALVFVWVCAYCEKAWLEYELLSEWNIRKEREEETNEQDNSATASRS